MSQFQGKQYSTISQTTTPTQKIQQKKNKKIYKSQQNSHLQHINQNNNKKQQQNPFNKRYQYENIQERSGNKCLERDSKKTLSISNNLGRQNHKILIKDRNKQITRLQTSLNINEKNLIDEDKLVISAEQKIKQIKKIYMSKRIHTNYCKIKQKSLQTILQPVKIQHQKNINKKLNTLKKQENESINQIPLRQKTYLLKNNYKKTEQQKSFNKIYIRKKKQQFTSMDLNSKKSLEQTNNATIINKKINNHKFKQRTCFNQREKNNQHSKSSDKQCIKRYPKQISNCLNKQSNMPPKFSEFFKEMNCGFSQIIEVNEPCLKKSNKITKVCKVSQNHIIPSLVQEIADVTVELPSIKRKSWVEQHYHPKLPMLQNVNRKRLFDIKILTQGVYYGQISQSGFKQGLGILFYQNGKVYQGQFLNDLKHGYGYQVYTNQSIYTGFYENGKKCGKGRFEWPNGEIYDGEWDNDKKHGSGSWKGVKSQNYVGQWKNDVIDGFGVFINGSQRYQGEFSNYQRHGKGIYIFKTGERYQGSFRRNYPHGEGEYFWTNGDYYKGKFMNGKRHGIGCLKLINGLIYEGEFRNDKKCGQGQQTYEQNLFFIGNFQNDLKHGWGTLNYQGIPIYQGFWINNHSLQTYSCPEVTTLQGVQQCQFNQNKVQNINSVTKKKRTLSHKSADQKYRKIPERNKLKKVSTKLNCLKKKKQ